MAGKSILNASPEELLSKYRQVLLQKGIPVEQMILFGSYSKGTAKPWSDLDVCVVSSSFGANNYDEMVMLKKLTTDIDPMIEPHPYNPKDLDNPLDPLAIEIKTYGRIVD